MNFLNHQDQFQSVGPLAERQRALEFIRAKGLPTRKNEDWKYTSLKALSEKKYIPSAGAATPSAETEKTIRTHFHSSFTNIVFINGLFNESLSQAWPAGVSLVNQAQPSGDYEDAFAALNVLYAPEFYALHVQKAVVVARPLHFIFWSEGELTMSSVQLKILVQNRSQIQLLTHFIGGAEDYFSNSVIHVDVAENAQVVLIKVQDEASGATHIGRTRVSLAKNSDVQNLCYSTGAQLGRHNLEILLQGEGARAQAHGIYAVTGTQHVDNNTTIDHQVGHCNSFQLYKGLLDGESHGVFTGKVFIRRQAQKANSEQLNNNLLLSRKAEADSKPMLEIDADDVKASHGSTVGQMNKEELFYLLSRGIPRAQAIPMMSYGFLSEVLYKLENEEIQLWLKQKLDKAFLRLSGETL